MKISHLLHFLVAYGLMYSFKFDFYWFSIVCVCTYVCTCASVCIQMFNKEHYENFRVKK